jgi:hypothetical protein
MYVPSYQMHNVLNVYSKQLSRNKMVGNEKIRFKKPLNDQIQLSPEGKRQATLEKVAEEILDKITRLGVQKEAAAKSLEQTRQEPESDIESDKQKLSEFVFHVIDAVNIKKTHSLSVEDTTVLMSRLEELVKEAVEKKGGHHD